MTPCIDPTGVIAKNNLMKIENRSVNLVFMFSRCTVCMFHHSSKYVLSE